MGACEGRGVGSGTGCIDGFSDMDGCKDAVGMFDGRDVGTIDGGPVGANEIVGGGVGCAVGSVNGWGVGVKVGSNDGGRLVLGSAVGSGDGGKVGGCTGVIVGAKLGASVVGMIVGLGENNTPRVGAARPSNRTTRAPEGNRAILGESPQPMANSNV